MTVTLSAEEYQAVIATAQKYQRRHQASRAIKLFLLAYETYDVRHREVCHLLGVCYVMKGDMTSAQMYFDQAIDSATTNLDRANILKDVGEAWSKSGEWENAEDLFDAALRLYVGLTWEDRAAGRSPASGPWVGLGALECFQAKHHMRVWKYDAAAGNIDGAALALAQAIRAYQHGLEKIVEGGNQHIELYKRLDFVDALLVAGDFTASREQLRLIRRLLPDFGGRAHRLRYWQQLAWYAVSQSALDRYSVSAAN